MSFPNAQVPSPSSEDPRSEFPEESQPSVEAGGDATEEPGGKGWWNEITDDEVLGILHSTPDVVFRRIRLGVHGNIEWKEFDDDYGGSRSAFVHEDNSVYGSKADEFVAPPPDHSRVRPLVPSTKKDGNSTWDETEDRWGSHSAFVRQGDSSYGVVDPISIKKAPGLSDYARRDRTSKRSSTNIREFTVKQSRLLKVLTVPETTTIYDARSQMHAEKAVVLVITNSNALVSGILTDKDIETRGVTREIDLVNTPVSEVMTKNLIFVTPDTPAIEALQLMVQGKVIQLPVIENGVVIASVDLMHCFSDVMANGGGREARNLRSKNAALLYHSRSTFRGSEVYTYTQIINHQY